MLDGSNEQLMERTQLVQNLHILKNVNKINMKVKKGTTSWGAIYYYHNSYCRFALYAYDDDHSAIYLSNVKVKKSERGKGIGNKILKFANKEARKHNYSIICLKVLKSSWMHDWYARHGYKDLCDGEENDVYVWMEHNLK